MVAHILGTDELSLALGHLTDLLVKTHAGKQRFDLPFDLRLIQRCAHRSIRYLESSTGRTSWVLNFDGQV
jgi:hypothetical protein